MKTITRVETISPQEFDAMSLDGFNIIYAVPEDGPVSDGDNVDRTIRLWADRDEGYMMTLEHSGEREAIWILHIAVPDISDEEAIKRLRQRVAVRLDQP